MDKDCAPYSGPLQTPLHPQAFTLGLDFISQLEHPGCSSFFPLPKCGKRNGENKRQRSAGDPVSLLWNYLQMLMSLGDACLSANGQSERCGSTLFGSLDLNAITWESGGKTLINDDGEKHFYWEGFTSKICLLARLSLTNKSDLIFCLNVTSKVVLLSACNIFSIRASIFCFSLNTVSPARAGWPCQPRACVQRGVNPSRARLNYSVCN